MAPAIKQPQKLYFISDLHIGGEGILNKFEAQKEFLQFLSRLFKTTRPGEARLYIGGDFLGLWEVKSKEGIAKLDFIQKTHPKIFRALKKLSQKIKIILIPGNHDYELAYQKEAPKFFKKWGIALLPKEKLSLTFHGLKIRLEHGNRFDSFNKIENFGSPHETPYAYHLIKDIVLRITRATEQNKKRRLWLANIALINPIEAVPYWFSSNYFYRELAPVLRYLIAPFLIFFTVSTALLALAVAERLELIKVPSILYLTHYLGPVQYLANTIIVLNFIFLAFFFILSLAFKIIRRDIKKNLSQYGIQTDKKIRIPDIKSYQRKIIHFFKQNPTYQLFISGHIHRTFLKKIKINGQNKIIANTGSWTKTFMPIKPWFRLPKVYFPYYRLSYLTLERKNQKTVLSLDFWPKKTHFSLTFLERFSIIFKKRNPKIKSKKIIL